MNLRVNREDFLRLLHSVTPGLSNKEDAQQSSCFLFQGGKIKTFNSAVACAIKSPLGKDVEAAVYAGPLLKILGKMVEPEIDIQMDGDEFLIMGKRRRSGIRLERSVTSEMAKHVKFPKKEDWKELSPAFCDAINIVSPCCGKDAQKFYTTCVHIHQKYVEATDNYRAIRYQVKTPIEQHTIIPRTSIEHISPLGMTAFAENQDWIHFRNPEGLIVSCLRYNDEFLDISPLLEVKGKHTVLPKGLAEAAERAEIFSTENIDKNLVRVDLKPGQIRVYGDGVTGWYSETKKIQYDGPALDFMIVPKLLVELIKLYNDCQINREFLKFRGDRFVFVATLTDPEK